MDIVECHDVHPIQPSCYNIVLRRYGNLYDWYAIIDIDEFITLPKEKDIKTFLSKFTDTDIIFLHWLNYGDSGLLQYEDKPVLERFVQHAIGGRKVPYIKSLFRADKIGKMRN